MLRIFLLSLALLPLALGSALAQPSDPPQTSAAVPDAFRLNMMIKSTVIAVNHANTTNNYTVLRDLGSPRFRDGNSTQKLGSIFEPFRRSKFDLSPILFFTPKLLQEPTVDGDGMLRLTGFFDTAPQRILFDLLFELVDGTWLLFGLNITTQRSPSPASSPNP